MTSKFGRIATIVPLIALIVIGATIVSSSPSEAAFSRDLDGPVIKSVRISSEPVHEGDPYCHVSGWMWHIQPSGKYGIGDDIEVTVSFDEPVVISGDPQFRLTMGGTKLAGLKAVEGKDVVFAYQVAEYDLDMDGIVIPTNAIVLQGGGIKDAAGNNADISMAGQPAQYGHRVDGVRPWLSSLRWVASGGPDGVYEEGDEIFFKAMFSEKVLISGTPSIQLDFDGVEKTATWSCGVWWKGLSYVVQPGDRDVDGIAIPAGVMSADAGAIRDEAGNAALYLGYVAKAPNSDIIVDGGEAEAPTANSPATGLPTISGTAQVGETLTADTSGISDDDGLDNARFSYQWQAGGSDIAGATNAAYTLVDADQGKTVSVTVSFTDDGGNAESLTSAATAAVAARPNTPATGLPTISGTAQVAETLTADVSGIADEDGLDDAVFSYQWQADGSDIAGATNAAYVLTDAEQGKTISVAVSFTDDAGNEETLTSAATTAVLPKPNSPATGLPTISGTAQVSETLTADTSGIADADGLTNATFSYQWVANDGSSDADIAGAMSSTYTLTFAEAEKTISVRVSFTDDRGNAESLTSAATEAVSATSQQQANSPATGQPTISGTAQVGQTLTADTSGIADEDGLADVSYSYQWQADGADIAGATGDTYTLADAEEGQAITVTVSFTDDAGNAESLTSAATNAVAPKPNTPATGLPTISGTAQVGETLVAYTSGISDDDGLTNATFSYQWRADGSDIAGATASSYALTDADEGRAISVQVSFTDDAGNAESLSSAATAAVAGPPPEPLTASLSNGPPSHDGENVFTFELHFSEEFSVSYKRLRDDAFIASGGDVTRAKRLERGSNIGWRIHVRPDGDGAVSIILPETTDCEATGAICAGDGRMLSNRSELTVSGP